MPNQLAKNIRALRREQGLTQEQLAEAMDVSVGAVSKWEQASSMPEIPMLMKLADFFQTSVDALLGYELLNNGREESIQRLKEYLNTKTYDGIWSDVEKTLAKYPHSFDIVYPCAELYHLVGMENGNKRWLKKAIELYSRCFPLLNQNQDDTVSELSIQISIAETYLSLGDTKKALQQLKEHNPCGINNARIGSTMASFCHTPDESLTYLSHALLSHMSQIMLIVAGYVSAFDEKKEYDKGLAILSWFLPFLQGLELPGKISFLGKSESLFLALCGLMSLSMGDRDAAKTYLMQARTTALRFDAAPNYGAKHVRFYYGDSNAVAYDDMGLTAMAGIEKILNENAEIPGLFSLWNEISSNEEKNEDETESS